MAGYFSKFPKIYFTVNDGQSVDRITNIMAKFSLNDSIKDNTAVYYEYDVTESDTPEIVANKMYGSPERHWVVLMMNNIVDPQYDWPMTTITLNNFIDAKYSNTQYANSNTSGAGLSYAESNVHSYYKVITTTIPNGSKIVNEYQVDANTHANVTVSTSTVTLADNNVITIATSKDSKTYYEHEVEQNESKRKIKLLKPEFVPTLEDEIRRVF
jgi:hypothetical protein